MVREPKNVVFEQALEALWDALPSNGGLTWEQACERRLPVVLELRLGFRAGLQQLRRNCGLAVASIILEQAGIDQPTLRETRDAIFDSILSGVPK